MSFFTKPAQLTTNTLTLAIQDNHHLLKFKAFSLL